MSDYVRNLPPDAIQGIFRRYANRVNLSAREERGIDAMWETRYWPETGIAATGRFDGQREDGNEWIENNTIYPFVTTYQSKLHDARMKVRVDPSPDGRGNHVYLQALINQWIWNVQVVRTLNMADQMALAHQGAALCVGYDDRKKDPLRRIFLRAIPWREVVVDADVGTIDDQRFIGRCTWMPVVEARQFFRDNTIVGRPRPADNFPAAAPGPYPPPEDGAVLDQVVRVLEIQNIVDDYWMGESNIALGGKPIPGFVPGQPTPVAHPGEESDLDTPDPADPIPLPYHEPAHQRGRREWYLPDEVDPWVPRKILPMPFRDDAGDPILTIFPLTYLHRIGLPLHGLSHAARRFDQMREAMIIRSRMATSTRKDTEQIFWPEGVFTEGAEDTYRKGTLKGALTYKPDATNGVPISSLCAPVPSPSVQYQWMGYANLVNQDLASTGMQSPEEQGRVTPDATATAVNIAQGASMDEIGLLRTVKTCVLEQVIRAWVCALRASMADLGATTTVKTLIDKKIVEVTQDDVLGDFHIEIEPGEASIIAEQRRLQQYLAFLQTAIPLAEKVIQGDEVSALALDELVERAGQADHWLSRNIKKMAMPGPPAEVPRGPGAGSAAPGTGSLPATPIPGESMPAGGPQPAVEQPMDNQTGLAQNGATPQPTSPIGA